MSDCDFYACSEMTERLSCMDPDEAIEEYLDGCGPLPESVTVYGWLRRKVGETERKWLKDSLLERALECLDEEYGDPDNPTDPTDEMEKAEAAFIEVVLAEYKSWACERVSEAKVNVREWCAKNRPEWLEKLPAAELPKEGEQ